MGQQEEKTREEEEEEGAASPLGKKQKSSREVYFSVLPDKYEPLIEEAEEERETPEERRKRKEEKKRKKKRKYKKFRKNIWKALRFSWSCLMIGLQNMASVYSTPASAAASVVTAANSGAGTMGQ
ncbi:required for drug-induced death protein 1-like [Paralichthys olivaceus]|uniref:required for drug-induced death protein 1-like n=1 Tax=Paralichthys olivaceus TaxID=8255 RepID=UPI0037516D29